MAVKLNKAKLSTSEGRLMCPIGSVGFMQGHVRGDGIIPVVTIFSWEDFQEMEVGL